MDLKKAGVYGAALPTKLRRLGAALRTVGSAEMVVRRRPAASWYGQLARLYAVWLRGRRAADQRLPFPLNRLRTNSKLVGPCQGFTGLGRHRRSRPPTRAP